VMRKENKQLKDDLAITKLALELACGHLCDGDKLAHPSCPIDSYLNKCVGGHFNKDEKDCPHTEDYKCWVQHYLTQARDELKDGDSDGE